MAQFTWRTEGADATESSEDEHVDASQGPHITLQQLKAIRVKYEEIQAHHDGEAELTEATFVSMLQSVLPPEFTRRELKRLFRHVDANANGSVDWDEFSSFVLETGHQKKEGQGRNMIYVKTDRAEGHGKTTYRNPDHHVGPTTAILCSSRNGKYYTCGRDGYVKVWQSGSLELEQSLYCGGRWATDAVFLKNESRLAVSSMDKIVTLFDLNYHERKGIPPYARLMRAFVGKKVSTGKNGKAVLSMPDEKKTTYVGGQSSASLLAGLEEMKKPMQRGPTDQHVEVCRLEDFDDFAMCIATHDRHTCLGLKTGHLNLYDLHSTAKTITCDASFPLHNGPISSVRSAQYIDAVITSGWDDTIKLLSLERQKIIRTLGGAERGEREKSIFAMDWSEQHRLLASAAAERTILLWNPYIPKPVYKLEGHNQPLVTVLFNPVYDQLFSLSLDKAIKVWDLRTMKCLQTITNEEMSLKTDDALSTLAFDKQRGALVCVSGYPTVFPLKASLAKFPPEPQYLGHHNPVIEVVGGLLGDTHAVFTCDSERVSVWNARTGARMYSWYTSNSMDCDRVVGMKIDENARRVILACPRKVKITNATNGMLLSELLLKGEGMTEHPCVAGREITAILYLHGKDGRQVLACVGPSIVIWEDGPSKAVKGFTRYSIHCNIAKAMYDKCAEVDLDTTVLTGCCAADANAGNVAIGTDKNMVGIYSIPRQRLLYTLRDYNPAITVEALSYNTTWDSLLVCTENRVTVYSLKTRKVLFMLSNSRMSPATGTVHAARSTADGHNIVTTDEDGTLYVWRVHPTAYATNDATNSSGGGADLMSFLPVLPGKVAQSSFTDATPPNLSPPELEASLNLPPSPTSALHPTSPFVVSKACAFDEPIATHPLCRCVLKRRMHQGPSAGVHIMEVTTSQDDDDLSPITPVSSGCSRTSFHAHPAQVFSAGSDCSVSTVLLTGEFVGVFGWEQKYQVDDPSTFFNPKDFDPMVINRTSLSVSTPTLPRVSSKQCSFAPDASSNSVSPPRAKQCGGGSSPSPRNGGGSATAPTPSPAAAQRPKKPKVSRRERVKFDMQLDALDAMSLNVEAPPALRPIDGSGAASPRSGEDGDSEAASPQTSDRRGSFPPLPHLPSLKRCRGLTSAAAKGEFSRPIPLAGGAAPRKKQRPVFSMESNIVTTELFPADQRRLRGQKHCKHRVAAARGQPWLGRRPKDPNIAGYGEHDIDWCSDSSDELGGHAVREREIEAATPNADEPSPSDTAAADVGPSRKLRFAEVRIKHPDDVDERSPGVMLRETRAERVEAAQQGPLASIVRARERDKPSGEITNTPSPVCYPLAPDPLKPVRPAMPPVGGTGRRPRPVPLQLSPSFDTDAGTQVPTSRSPRGGDDTMGDTESSPPTPSKYAPGKRGTGHALAADLPADDSDVGVGARQVMRLMQRGRKADWALRANSKLKCPDPALNIRVPKYKRPGFIVTALP